MFRVFFGVFSGFVAKKGAAADINPGNLVIATNNISVIIMARVRSVAVVAWQKNGLLFFPWNMEVERAEGTHTRRNARISRKIGGKADNDNEGEQSFLSEGVLGIMTSDLWHFMLTSSLLSPEKT